MPAETGPTSANFEPTLYRQSIAQMFCGLAPDAQRDLIERLAILPRHIHRMATDGQIAHRLPIEKSVAAGSRR